MEQFPRFSPDSLAKPSVSSDLKRHSVTFAANVCSFLNAFQGFCLVRLHATVPTPTLHGCPWCGQRYGDNSRQTDFKAPTLQRIARFCYALSPSSVTARQRLDASRDSKKPSASERRLASIVGVAPHGIIVGGLIQFSIQRGAPDFQPTRDLGHLAAVVRDC